MISSCLAFLSPSITATPLAVLLALNPAVPQALNTRSLSIAAVAADSLQSLFVLPTEIGLLKSVHPTLQAKAEEMIRPALLLIRDNVPPQLNSSIFAWRADPHLLERKSVQLRFTTSTDPALAQALGGMLLPAYTDGVTSAFMIPETNQFTIVAFILLDRVFSPDWNSGRAHDFARLVTAMAHALFGPGQNFLIHPIPTQAQDGARDHDGDDMVSHRTTIDFLKGLLAKPEIANNGNLYNAFVLRLNSERTALSELESHNP